GRAAAAARHCASAHQERAHSYPGRSHVGAGQRVRTPGTGVARTPDARPHHPGYRASLVHGAKCRPHHRSRCGQNRRASAARPASGGRRPVRVAVQHAVPRRLTMPARGRHCPCSHCRHWPICPAAFIQWSGWSIPEDFPATLLSAALQAPRYPDSTTPLLTPLLYCGVGFQMNLVATLLGGDDAVVIALACRRLAPARRIYGIFCGTAGPIFLRVALISFALVLAAVPFMKII